ncbi:putative transposase [Parabacteroides sp. PF5-5]|uniref:IS200/IS605 family transposase n=1 Tax=unclassified Parabacteroides TaxID=2649774 RepID=UPI0024748907|nr:MULTISPECIES: IS200/IS605 family transposase [unclassified Parabacteroides]MDH6305643.1 putative transposase [Parabacteroides sp. PH5-39]MDH6316319.1 putative transposase [Parabacteroides sp. PF5-13]MDH6319802.1 putative transposase [Parabacteroides sp. PH5-13]MDH6323607.1 putative transposase [Parabacteroides sp. PH5-8]MDH6327506.1 putative transposase [Parabacteroides sp. PH5-41]
MANTYTQIYVQLVFTVKNKSCLINESFREEVQKYINGIIVGKNCKLYAIYANPDHVHILISIKPTTTISDLVRDIKACSAKFINERHFIPYRFQWQEGYGSFSYSQSQLTNVVHYILNQPEHHREKSFKEEYLHFLEKFHIDYDERYLFDWICL